MFQYLDMLCIKYFSLRRTNAFRKLLVAVLASFILVTFLSRKSLEELNINDVIKSERYFVDTSFNQGRRGQYAPKRNLRPEKTETKLESNEIYPINPDGLELKLENTQMDTRNVIETDPHLGYNQIGNPDKNDSKLKKNQINPDKPDKKDGKSENNNIDTRNQDEMELDMVNKPIDPGNMDGNDLQIKDNQIHPRNPSEKKQKLENSQKDQRSRDEKEPKKEDNQRYTENTVEIGKHKQQESIIEAEKIEKKYYDRYDLERMSKNLDENSELKNFLHEQEKRKKLVEETCATSRKRFASSKYKFLFVDDVTHITYCPVAKVASTTWSLNMLKLRDINIDYKEFDKFWYKGQVKQYPKKTYRQIDTKSTKFMVFRHPMNRLVSCYRDKFINNSHAYYYRVFGKNMMKLRHERAIKSNTTMDPPWPTFEEFINTIVKTKAGGDDVHWQPYHELCLICKVFYDFLLRFEDIHEENKLFIQYLHQTSRLNISETWQNKGRAGKTVDDDVCKFFSTISWKTFQKVIEKYKKDFILFDYDMTDYSSCPYIDKL